MMHQEEKTPRAGNYKPDEDLRGWSSCDSQCRSLLSVPHTVARTEFRNTSSQFRVATNIEKNTEDKGRRHDITGSGLHQRDDHPQCRYLDNCKDNESRSISTSTSATEERSRVHFQAGSATYRFVQVRHNTQRHLIAVPVVASSWASNSCQGGEDMARILSAAFNINCRYKVVGLIGPLFVDNRVKKVNDMRETSVVLPLALLGHPDAAFIDCYYNKKFADEGKDRHEFELLLHPRPIQEKEQDKINKPAERASDVSFIDSEAISLTSDNLGQEQQPDYESDYCHQLSHAEQTDMMDIAQVLLECHDIDLPAYMALIDGIMKKNQDLSRVYHEHLVRVEESSWDNKSSSSGSKKSKSSHDEFEDHHEGTHSYFYQSVDKMMEDIREIACSMKPVFPVTAKSSALELRHSAESTVATSSSVETAITQEEKSKISNELIHAAAILVHQGRITLEAATILVSTFTRERNPLVSAIHKHYTIHRDFSQFLNMLEWLSTDGYNKALFIDRSHGEGHVKLDRYDDASLDDLSNDGGQQHLDMEYEVLFEQVGEWDDFGPLEIAALRMCASQSIPGLISAIRNFKDASEKGRVEFRKAVRCCVDQFLERPV